MLRRTSDYRPVKIPFSQVTRLNFNHWRTEWRPPLAGEKSSALMSLVGCGSSTWEVYSDRINAFLRLNWIVLEGDVISLTDSLDTSRTIPSNRA